MNRRYRLTCIISSSWPSQSPTSYSGLYSVVLPGSSAAVSWAPSSSHAAALREDSRLTFLLGGARSGKSAHAEDLVTRTLAPWTYIATAQSFDDEMSERIALHRIRRGSDWETIEAPHD